MPAASIAASVSARSRAARSPGRSPHAFIGRSSVGRGTLARIECSEPAEMDALSRIDPFGARAPLGPGLPDWYRVSALDGVTAGARLPVTIRILLENLLRHAGGGIVEAADVETLASWRPGV